MSARVVLSFTTVTLLVFVLAACVWAQPRDPRPPLGPSPAAPATVLPPPPPPPSPPAAVVNGRVVTEEEATRFAWTQMGRQILEGVIDQILIRQAANAAGLKVSSEEVTKRIASLAIEAGNTEKLIAQRGVAGLAALRTQIETEILLEKLVENASKVTEEEARVYYEAHLAEYSTPTQIHLFEIVTQEAETAYQSRRRIASGEAFGTVAKETSAAASAANGGDLGWVTLEQVEPPALRPVVATLTVGEVSTPILANGKFYIVMVSEKKAGETKSYESVRDEILAKLRAEKGASKENVLMSLRRRAKISIAAEPYRYLAAEYAQLGQVKVVADGKPVTLSKPPIIVPPGRVIAPVAEVFRALGCRVQWVARTKTLVVGTEEKSVRLTVGSDKGELETGSLPLDGKVELRDGVVWAAPRPIAEALGFKLRWDPWSYTLEFSKPAE